jgi:hypothetical protein
MAFWSGPSWKAFSHLKQVIERLDAIGRLELVVVDADGCPELYALWAIEHDQIAPSGAGETAWIKDGRIVSTSGFGFHPECFEPLTLQLLEECQQRAREDP